MNQKKQEKLQKQPASLTPVRILILVAALVFIVLGILNGSCRDVFIKAATICTQCIGLG